MKPCDLEEPTDKRERQRSDASREFRKEIVNWYCAKVYSCQKGCEGRKSYSKSTGEKVPVPPFMTFVGKRYAEKYSRLLFVGLNPWVKDEWVDGADEGELALMWEKKVYQWLDYGLGAVLEAISPIAQRIWARENTWKDLDEGTVLDHVGFTNIVKCPLGSPGEKPTEAMESHCPEFLLDEIGTLKPGIIVIFGNDVWRILRGASQQGVGARKVSFLPGNRDSYAGLEIDTHCYPILTLAHPSGPGNRPSSYINQKWFEGAIKRCLEGTRAEA